MDATTLHQALTAAEIQTVATLLVGLQDATNELPIMYADITLTEKNNASKCLYINNNGTHRVTITAKLRYSTDTTISTNIVSIGTAIAPFVWNIIFREARFLQHDTMTENIADPFYMVLPGSFIAGVCTLQWKVTNTRSTMCYIQEGDFGRISLTNGMIYQVKLIAPVKLIIYEAL
jgi:hypothetical protein